MTDPLNETNTYLVHRHRPDGQRHRDYPMATAAKTYSYYYNADDELTSVVDPLDDITSYGYDGVGNQITVTDANGNTTTYAYDSTNELTTVTDALGDTTVYGYDAAGNQQTVTDALGHTTTTLYDAARPADNDHQRHGRNHHDHL